jgi:sugar lactone lactonase YvrE
MLEVDTAGRSVFASGEWPQLLHAGFEGGGDEEAAVDPGSTLEQLLASTDQGQLVLGMVHEAIQPGQAADAIVHIDGQGLRRVHVEPIASPLLAGVSHALLTVLPTPPGGTVSVAGDPSWSAPVASADADPDDPELATTGDLQQTEGQDSTETELLDEHDAESGTRRKLMWLSFALLALALLALWALFGRGGDAASEMGPIDVEVLATEPVEIEPGQTWRTLGVAGLSEVHGIAAIDDGALVASVTGRIVRLDGAGEAQSVVVVGDPALSAISDLTATADGTSWALDAGMAQMYRISPDGDVTILEANFDPLRNARGIALGSDDTVWVASTASASIVRIGRDGGVVSTLPFPGRQPSDVIELDDGTLWFVDAEVIELVHVTPAGEILDTLPIESFFSNESPHLAVIDDVMWVTEPAQGSVFAVDLATNEPTGDRIMLTRPQGERVERPIGLTSDQDGQLWTVDSLGRATIVLGN